MQSNSTRNRDIAVVGMSVRYPDAPNLQTFWANLVNGRDAIREVPSERWDHARFYDPDLRAPNKSCGRWGGFLEQVDRFEPLFFNISPLEAEWMDPQHRLVLETAYAAIEDAGYAAESLAGARGSVFIGCKE